MQTAKANDKSTIGFIGGIVKQHGEYSTSTAEIISEHRIGSYRTLNLKTITFAFAGCRCKRSVRWVDGCDAPSVSPPLSMRIFSVPGLPG
jgi:hypothetical protein